MKISVIIPAYNEETFLPTLLASLQAQPFSKNAYEVIVVEKVKDKPDVVLNPDGKALLLTAGSVTEAAFQAGAKLATCTFNANGKIEVLVRPFSA